MKFEYNVGLRNIDKANMCKLMGFSQKLRKQQALNALDITLWRGYRIITQCLKPYKFKLDLRRSNHKIIHNFFPKVKEIPILGIIQINGKRCCQNPKRKERHIYNFKSYCYVVLYRNKVYILTETKKIHVSFKQTLILEGY